MKLDKIQYRIQCEKYRPQNIKVRNKEYKTLSQSEILA